MGLNAKTLTMGNVQGRQAALNIPPDGNDVNHAYSAQMLDMILHFAVPVFSIAAVSHLSR